MVTLGNEYSHISGTSANLETLDKRNPILFEIASSVRIPSSPSSCYDIFRRRKNKFGFQSWPV